MLNEDIISKFSIDVMSNIIDIKSDLTKNPFYQNETIKGTLGDMDKTLDLVNIVDKSVMTLSSYLWNLRVCYTGFVKDMMGKYNEYLAYANYSDQDDKFKASMENDFYDPENLLHYGDEDIVNPAKYTAFEILLFLKNNESKNINILNETYGQKFAEIDEWMKNIKDATADARYRLTEQTRGISTPLDTNNLDSSLEKFTKEIVNDLSIVHFHLGEIYTHIKCLFDYFGRICQNFRLYEKVISSLQTFTTANTLPKSSVYTLL